MKRKLLLLKTLTIALFLMMGVGNAWGQVFITELADPDNNANVRYIELYNSGATSIDFTEGSGWRIDKYTNASATVSQTLALTGTIPAGGFYLIATGTDDGDFFTVYGVTANQFDGANDNVAGSNGDDNLEVYNGSGILIDQFGVPGEDGTNTNHEFEDGRAERKATVITGNTTYTFAEWNIWNDTGGAGTTNLPQNAPDDFDPGAWIGASSGPTITVSPSSLTGFTYLEGNGPSAEQTITVSGSNLTNDISIAASTNYEISKTSGSGFTTPLTFAQASGTVEETTVYVRLKAGLDAGSYNSETITATSTDATDKTVTCSGSVTAPPDPEPTNHVVGFSATAAGATQINLSWGDNDGAQAAAGFLIVGKTGAGTYLSVADGTDPADDTDWSDNNFNVKVAHGTQSYQVTGLTAETQYDFEIYPYTNSGSDIDFKTDGTVPEQSATTDEAPSIVAPTAGVVFISEVSDAASNFNAEFLELFNNSGKVIDLTNSKIVRYPSGGGAAEYVWDFSTDGSGDIQIPANGILVIARGATKGEFETEWGALPNGVNYNEGNSNLYFGAGRQWALKDGGTSNADDGTEIDATNQAVANGDRDYQYPTGTWNNDIEGNSNPGVLSSDEDPAAHLWDGGASTSNWNDANNWNPNQIPGANTNVTIPSSKQEIIIQPTVGADCYNLTVNGTLTIESNSTNTGSLIINGSVSSSGTITVKRYIEEYTAAANGWHLLSSPVATFNINSNTSIDPGDNDDFYGWSESTYTWMNHKQDNPSQMVPGTGYLIAYASTATKEFSGALNNSAVSYSNLSKTADQGNGWHLVGNPFQSAITWNSPSLDWNLSSISGTAKLMTNTGGFNDLSSGDPIPSMQGFWIQAETASNSFTIPLTARDHDAMAWIKSSNNNAVIIAANDLDSGMMQKSWVRFNADATEAYDSKYDSRFMAWLAPQLYSIVDNEKLSTNTYPEFAEEMTIPFGFVKNESTNFSIELLETMTEVDVYLTDLKLNIDTKLNIGSAYSFSSQEGDNPDRFLLHFGIVGIEDNTANLSQINAYAYQNQLYVQSNSNEARVSLFDIQGHQLLSREINGAGSSRIPLDLPSGIYIVRLQSNNQVKNVKVFIN